MQLLSARRKGPSPASPLAGKLTALQQQAEAAASSKKEASTSGPARVSAFDLPVQSVNSMTISLYFHRSPCIAVAYCCIGCLCCDPVLVTRGTPSVSLASLKCNAIVFPAYCDLCISSCFVSLFSGSDDNKHTQHFCVPYTAITLLWNSGLDTLSCSLMHHLFVQFL